MKRTSVLAARAGATLALSALSFLSFSEAAPRLLPFQGRLTDASGTPVPDGAKVVQFKMYDAPTGGSAVWNGELQKVTVNGGLVSTLLGSKTDLSAVDFNQALYLEITVDANADNQITAADPPLLPRQSILPAVFAVEAENSRKLSGYPVDQLPSNVPVGGVIMWWGATANIPSGFELCDGGAPTTAGALLSGNKPDLRDRFVKGATNGAANVQAAAVTGGTNTFAGNLTGGTALTLDQIPAHTHGINDPGHTHGVTDPGHRHTDDFWANGASLPAGTINYKILNQLNPYNTGFSTTGISIQSRATGITLQNSGGGNSHTHTIPTENRPAFLELLFIIRVK